MSYEEDNNEEEDEALRIHEESVAAEMADRDPANWEQFFVNQDLEQSLITDFVSTWTEALNHQTDAHWSFKEMTALYLISLFCHWKWTFLDFSRMMDSDTEEDGLSGLFFLNIWVMVLGKSRIARKTTVFRKVRRIIKSIGWTTEVVRDNNEIQEIGVMLEHEFNPASFVQSMNERIADGFCYATWMDDEVSRFYEQMAGATYMAGIAPALSKIYDPLDDYSRRTISRGRESIDKSYFTVLTASTMSLPQLFSEREIMQGFLNRFMFVLDDPKDREDRIDPENATLNVLKTFDKIKEWLKAMYECNPTSLYILPKSPQAEFMKKVENETNKMIREDEIPEMYQGYVGNTPDFIIKLACLYRIARIPYHDLVNIYQEQVSSGVSIDLVDLERAKKLTDILYENFKKVVRLSRKKTVLGSTINQDSNLITVYEAIEQSAEAELEGWSKRYKAVKKSGVGSQQFGKIILDLIERQCITIKEEKGKRGPKSILYKALVPPI